MRKFKYLGHASRLLPITSLQTYARWYMERGGKIGNVPDVLPYIHTGILDEIDPKPVITYR